MNKFILLCFGVILSAYAHAASLHVIMVGDVATSNLQGSLQLDMLQVEEQLLLAAQHTGLHVYFHSLVDENVSAASVVESLRSLTVDEDDVIFFYYSGHGYRTSTDQDNPLPRLFFAKDSRGLELSWVVDCLKSKHARLTIVVGDCCNNVLPDFLAPPLVEKSCLAYLSQQAIQRNYQQLFVEASGVVVVASSSPGQVAYSVRNKGSFFTQAFIDALTVFSKSLSPQLLGWQDVLERACESTNEQADEWGVSQHPIYFIEAP